MGKTFKNLVLQNQGFLVAESLHISSETGGLPKLLKWWSYIDIWPFYCEVNFASLCICMGKIFRISNTSPLEPLGQFCTNFIWSLLRLGEWNIAKMVAVHWPRWPPCPYMVKTFKNLLLQNRGRLGAESLLKSSGTTKVDKIMVLQVCFPMHLYGKKHLKILFSKTEDALWLNLCIY